MKTSTDLGAERRVCERRSPLALLLWLPPAMATLILVIVVLTYVRSDNLRPPPSTQLLVGAVIAEVVAVAGFLWLRRKIRPQRLVLYEHGFAFRGQAIRWDAIARAGEASHGGLQILSVTGRDGTVIDLHGHITGPGIYEPVRDELRARGLLR